MKKTLRKNSLLVAVTAASFMSSPLINAASNPFSNTELASGFSWQGHSDLNAGGSDKRCGEGAEKVCVEGKCGEDKKACVEGKCGEGQCGANCDGSKNEQPKASDDKAAEGKCGEGKCGEGMMN